ncbi:MAG: hypothetical protein K8H86_08045, partial [Ignavibacteriaceae bacterium]|nr:hypothetical protein [Ignavibacteriaceae bacterium]
MANEMKPMIQSYTALSEKLNYMTDELQKEVQCVQVVVGSVRDRIDLVLKLEEKVRGGIKGSIVELLKNISAVS